METKILTWLGREFVEISGEAKAGASVEGATAELFERFEAVLKSHGLSLDNTVRIRVYGRDRQGRTDATMARSKILRGSGRAASSSFISPGWFDSCRGEFRDDSGPPDCLDGRWFAGRALPCTQRTVRSG